MATAPTPRITEEEYLRLERAAETKSEFVGGAIVPRPGGPLVRALLAARWIAAVAVQLRGRNFPAFDSNLRIRTFRTGSYLYPDLSVVCGKPETYGDEDDILTNPTVVIDVLPPSSSDFQSGGKFILYREIPSLKDYIAAHTGTVLIEHYSRQPESWLFREYRSVETSVHIESIECTIPLKDVYGGVAEFLE